MRGSPVLQAILVVVIFALAGVPVWRLTRSGTAQAVAMPNLLLSAAKPSQNPEQSIEVNAVFAPPVTNFQIKYLGKTVLEGRGPNPSFTTRWLAAIPAEGVDLIVQAQWSDTKAPPTEDGAARPSSPAAARVTVRFGDGREVEKSFWTSSNRSLVEVLTVPGETSAATP